MAIIAEILAGLGLLFVGLKLMSTHLQQATGRRVRNLLRTATRSPLVGLLCGTLAGAATQSSNAVAIVSGNLVRGGVLTTRDAIPIVAGGNVGTAALVFVAAIDFRLLVLYLVALVGFGFQFRLDRRPVMKEWMGVGLGLALALLGLDLIKHGPRALDVSTLAAVLGDGLPVWLGFTLGFIAAAISQSSSTPTILVVALMHAQVLGLGDAVFVVMGANLGSGVSALAAAGGLEGTGRQLCYVHVLVKGVGCVLVGALLGGAYLAGLDPLDALDQLGGHQASASLSILFLALQLAGAVPVSFARSLTEGIAARFSPPTVEDSASRPRFIHHRALEDSATGLDLAEQETMRLVKLMPNLLPDLDQQDASGPAERLALWRGATAIVVAIDQFLADLISRGMPRQSLQIALHLQALVETVRTLQDTLHGFTEVVEGFEDLPPLGFNLSESLRTIILSLADATEGDATDLDLIVTLAGDRSELLSRIRRQLGASALGTGTDARQLLLATSLFERGVWLVRRTAVALRAQENEANRESAAPEGAALKRVEADTHRT